MSITVLQKTKAKRLGLTPLNAFNFTFEGYRWAVATISTRLNNVPASTPNDDGGWCCAHPNDLDSVMVH